MKYSPDNLINPDLKNQGDEVVCDLIVPDGFSPNGDGRYDYFQVQLIDKYPDAVLKVFSGTGTLVFEQDHYGNLDYRGNEDAAWWDGSMSKSKDKLPAGTYIYIRDLDHGSKDGIVWGYVFLSR